MKYKEVIELLDKKFKRYTGIKKSTFELLVSLVKEEQKCKKKIGGPQRLCIEDQILVALAYWREYRTQEHLAIDHGVSQQTIGRAIIKVENILIKSGRFVLQRLEGEEALIIDVMECPIERPKKKQKRYYSGKKKRHTQKIELRIGERSKKIEQVVYGKGKEHDFKIHKKKKIKDKEVTIKADKGYQGIKKTHPKSETPYKKSKKVPLTQEQREFNKRLNAERGIVEHVIRSLKIFKILSYPYRNRRKRFGLRVNLIAGIYNLELNIP